MKQIIEAIDVRYCRIPLERVLVDAIHGDHTHFELIITIIKLENGLEGIGYTYTGGKGGKAIQAMIEKDLIPVLIGKDAACIEKLWHEMQIHIHYVGRGGVDAFAISAIDIALWDLRAKSAKIPLWKLIGGGNPQVKAYAGAIDLNFSLEELVANNRNYLEQGFTAVKIKLGKSTIEEDIERVKVVRKEIGKDTIFMVDANTGWSVERAIKTEKILRDYNIHWIEEPIIPDDMNGYRRITRKAQIPIAAGENFHSIYEFKHMLEYSEIEFPQPDVSNIGGITGWLKVANLVYAHNLPVSSHGMQELHVSLLAGMTHAGYLEVHSFPIDRYTTTPFSLKEGFASPPESDGHGVEFLWSEISPYQI